MNLSRERLSQILPNVGVLLRPNIDDLDEDVVKDLSLVEGVFHENNMTVPQAVKSMSQSCDDMVERCSWEGEIFDCSRVFRKRATFNGYCCSFNYGVVTKWTEHPDLDPYKLRSYRHGPGSGLQVLLNPMQEDYLWGPYLSTGFFVVVHRSGLYPEGSEVFIAPKREAFIRIHPKIVNGDDQLKSIRPNRRNCTFYNERKLLTSRSYSREACVLQCRALAVLQLCGCVPFQYMKQAKSTEDISNIDFKEAKNKTTSPCSLRHLTCLKKNTDEIDSENTIVKCECWTQCTLLSYGVTLNTGPFDAVKYYIGDFYKGTNTTGRSSVNVFFARQVASQFERNLIYSVEELMAKMGGLFSLFLGCSLLTAMEFVYFSLVRLVLLFNRLIPYRSPL